RLRSTYKAPKRNDETRCRFLTRRCERSLAAAAFGDAPRVVRGEENLCDRPKPLRFRNRNYLAALDQFPQPDRLLRERARRLIHPPGPRNCGRRLLSRRRYRAFQKQQQSGRAEVRPSKLWNLGALVSEPC